jgi:peptidyl-dipeptidase A
MKKTLLVLLIASTVFALACATSPGGAVKKGENAMTAEQEFSAYLDSFVAKLKPLYKADALAWWVSSISGKDEDFARRTDLDNQMDRLFSNRADFARIKAWRNGGQVKDPALKRQLEILYLSFLPKQVDTKLLERMSELSAQVDQIFNTYRADLAGKKASENDLRKILRESKSSAEVEAAWKAFHGVGRQVESRLKELVTLRNKAAKELGYPNYHALMLASQELDGAEVLALFDDLDASTRDVFAALKSDVDAAMAKRYGIKVDDLRPWHYADMFFQEAPAIYEADLDKLYTGRKLEDTARKFYDGMGLEVDDILARSDLYEKPGKSPHAFCTDMDREGDIRTLQNLVPDERWMGTLLHELGHGVYYKYIDRNLPYILRDASHILTTEAVAMFFGRQSKDGAWIRDNLGLSESEVKPVAGTAAKMLKLEQIVFSRWTQVMLRFEKAMYENPDQDLSRLWWDLKAKYQLLKPEAGRNEPDYAAKIHIVSVPVYYHNYMMGELFASQMYAKLRADAGLAADAPLILTGSKAAGDFFKAKVFKPGASVDWRTLVKGATGEPLSAKAFASQFITK